MERETGIEPALVAWKATVLPLNYSRPDDLSAEGLRRTEPPSKTSSQNQKTATKTQNFVVEGGGFEPPKA